MPFSLSQRLTKKAKKVLTQVTLISGQKNWKKTDSVFLAEALLKNKNNLGGLILKKHFSQRKIHPKKNTFSVSAVIEEALHLAAFSKNSYLGTEHLANGLINLLERNNIFSKKKKNASPANQLDDIENEETFFSDSFPLQPEAIPDLNSLIKNFFSGKNAKGKMADFLEKFCINLNSRATKENYFLIGRENELERIVRILNRRNKNNPVLVGEPGVGKTAIVEGLAEKINRHSAGSLNGKKILTLDLGLLLAGTNFRGEFESRLKEIIAQAQKDRDIILFIDEIHTLVGAGNAIGGMDAANILKPALSRGEIQVIGATTLDEYQKYIEKDAALERRFQPIFVDEPNIKESCAILKGTKKFYESHHHLKISEHLIPEIVQLAKEYLPERFLPDSAIDLLDEAAALRHTLSDNQEIYQKISQKKELLEKFVRQKEFLVINERYEEAVNARKNEKKVEQELKALQIQLSELKKSPAIELQKEDIWQVLSQSARIPIELIAQKNQNIPALITKKLEENLIGQTEVIEKIQQTLLRQFSGLSNRQRPLGSFFFIGGAGVGKTLTAQLLSRYLSPFGKENLIQINMSELTENHSVSRLLGAPAGYVGYEESGELAEKIRRNPYCVVLFDELEKAGPAAINLLLKILEEGSLADSKGRNIDFRHAIIILTSNFATDKLNNILPIGFSDKKNSSEKKSLAETKESILFEIKEIFSKELLDRLDHILIFNNLTSENLIEIVKKELAGLQKKLRKKDYLLQIDSSVFSWIAEKSLQPEQGARIVRQTIQDQVEPLLAAAIFRNSEQKKWQLTINKKQQLTLKKIGSVLGNKNLA